MNFKLINLFIAQFCVIFLTLALSFKGMTADFTVNTTDDLIDLNPGDGICEATLSANDCSLRAAILESNFLTSNDRISIPAGVFVLDLIGEDNFTLVGDLDVSFSESGELIIEGVSREQTIIDGNGTDRIFDFFTSDITVQNLTLRNGGDANATDLGGAIRFRGNSLNIFNVKFENNRANAGGAIYAGFETMVTIKNSIFTNNTTVDLGLVSRKGSAIYCAACNIKINSSSIHMNHIGYYSIWIQNDGYLEMLNSTVSNNDDGGIRISNSNALIKFSTIVDNTQPGDFSSNLSLFSFDGTQFLYIGHSIIQNSAGRTCQTSSNKLPTSLGYNVISDTLCDFSMIGDMQNTDAQLGGLTNNGGTTLTHHPTATSPVIDQVPIADCLDLQGIALLTDQRGESRPFGPLCDIGAVEVNYDIIFINGFEN